MRRQVAVTHLLAIPELVAVTDCCPTPPRFICRRLERDPRQKVLPAPVDRGRFPLEMAWHVRYLDDPAHCRLRCLIDEVAMEVAKEVAGADATSQ